MGNVGLTGSRIQGLGFGDIQNLMPDLVDQAKVFSVDDERDRSERGCHHIGSHFLDLDSPDAGNFLHRPSMDTIGDFPNIRSARVLVGEGKHGGNPVHLAHLVAGEVSARCRHAGTTFHSKLDTRVRYPALASTLIDDDLLQLIRRLLGRHKRRSWLHLHLKACLADIAKRHHFRPDEVVQGKADNDRDSDPNKVGEPVMKEPPYEPFVTTLQAFQLSLERHEKQFAEPRLVSGFRKRHKPGTQNCG